MKWFLISKCSNEHVTKTEMHNPTVTYDSVVSGGTPGNFRVDGYCGSDADFCVVCETAGVHPVEMKPIGTANADDVDAVIADLIAGRL